MQNCGRPHHEIFCPGFVAGHVLSNHKLMRDQTMTRRTISIPSVCSNTFQIFPNPDLSKFHQLIQHWSPTAVSHRGHIALRLYRSHTLSLCTWTCHPSMPTACGSVVTLVRGCMYTSEHVILQNEQVENLGNLYSINCSLDGIKTIYLKLRVDLS